MRLDQKDKNNQGLKRASGREKKDRAARNAERLNIYQPKVHMKNIAPPPPSKKKCQVGMGEKIRPSARVHNACWVEA